MSDLNKTLGAITLYKSADESTFQAALQEYYSKSLRASALQQALGVGAAGLGVGLGARGLLGLLGLGKHNVSPEEPYSSSVIEIDDEEEKEASMGGPLGKSLAKYKKPAKPKAEPRLSPEPQDGWQSGSSVPGIGYPKQLSESESKSDAFKDSVESTLERLEEESQRQEFQQAVRQGKAAAATDKSSSFLDFVKGRYAETTAGVPWAMPAAVGAGAGGLYGGWKMMDYLLDKRRESRVDEELEEAKAEYEAALADTKEAADGSFGKDLDELYNNLNMYGEKAAASWPEISGQAAGVYGTTAGLGALLMAIMGYKHGKKKQRKRVIRKAQTSRRREEYRKRPDPLFARARQGLTLSPTTADESSDAAPSLDEIEDQLI